MPAQARLVPPRDGARWVLDGWRIFRAAPLGWLATVMGYLLLTNILALVPLLGLPAALLLVPPLSLGLMAAARAAAAGATPDLTLLFSAFRADWRAQLLLGIIYMACSLAVVGAMVIADGEGALRQVLAGSAKPDELELGSVLLPLFVAALVYLPLMMAFWFAPPLAAWHGLSVGKALFFSFAACVINWRVFLVYGLVLGALLFAIALLGTALTAGGLISRHFVIGALIVVLPTVFASFYASYRDVFEPGEETP